MFAIQEELSSADVSALLDDFSEVLLPDCCGSVWSAPFPYCQGGTGGGLTFRPAQGLLPNMVGFFTQTTFDDDIVWLDSPTATIEINRGCAQNGLGSNQTLGGIAWNGSSFCNGFDTMFSASSTTNSGFVFETAAFPPGFLLGSGKCQCPTDRGMDNLACPAGNNLAHLRTFNFTGLSVGDRVEALAVVNVINGVPPVNQTLLAVSNITTGVVSFVDPTSPSCAASTVNVVASCTINDDTLGVAVAPTGMAWPGGNDLVVGDRVTRKLYRIDLTNFSCDVVSDCPAPGAGVVDGVAYDSALGVFYVMDDVTQRIYVTPGP